MLTYYYLLCRFGEHIVVHLHKQARTEHHDHLFRVMCVCVKVQYSSPFGSVFGLYQSQTD